MSAFGGKADIGALRCALLSGGQNRSRCLRSVSERGFDCAHIPAGIQWRLFRLKSIGVPLHLVSMHEPFSSVRIERKQLLGMRYPAQGVSTH
jgi:hypothetical protein